VNAIVIFAITRKIDGEDHQTPKPRAGMDKEPGAISNHIILTRHLGDTEADIDETTSKAEYAVGCFHPSPILPSAKHRKTPSSSRYRNPLSPKSTRTSSIGAGGHPGGGGAGAGRASETESREPTLSQIGDFATTRDDGGNTASGIHTTASIGNLKVSFGKESRPPGGGGKTSPGGDVGEMQMVPVPSHEGSDHSDTTDSAGPADSQQGDSTPRAQDSALNVPALGDSKH